ncbi:hypothetical protein CEXT_82381 [Caerostris extrusa]|uniref:Uncharacterized protein n=1 Tax=Caerostris extrusa TaxID=172846 RepID=A0AAV4QL24_CAEEX|nr:hypothetical protein CEXT_82381 [Caerostris extrusa]
MVKSTHKGRTGGFCIQGDYDMLDDALKSDVTKQTQVRHQQFRLRPQVLFLLYTSAHFPNFPPHGVAMIDIDEWYRL